MVIRITDHPPFISHGKDKAIWKDSPTSRSLKNLLTVVIKHILTGMILQVPMILIKYTLVFPNIAIGNGPLEDVFPTFLWGISIAMLGITGG